MACCSPNKPFCFCCEYPSCFISCLLTGFGSWRNCCGSTKRCVDRKISYTLLISEDENGITIKRTIVWARNNISISQFELNLADSMWLIPELERCKQIRCSEISIVSHCSEAFRFDHLDKIASTVKEAPPSALQSLAKFGITLSLPPDTRVYESILKIMEKLPYHMKRIELNLTGADDNILTLLKECLRTSPKLIKVEVTDNLLESVLGMMNDNYSTKLWIKLVVEPDRPLQVVELMERLQKNWQDSDQLHQNGVEVQFSAPLSVWSSLPAENYLYKSNKSLNFTPMYAQLRCIFERQEDVVCGRVALCMGLEGKENKSLGFGVRARY